MDGTVALMFVCWLNCVFVVVVFCNQSIRLKHCTVGMKIIVTGEYYGKQKKKRNPESNHILPAIMFAL